MKSHRTDTFHKLHQQCGIWLNTTSGYHPPANSKAEAANKHLMKVLCAYATKYGKNWDRLIVMAQLAVNNSINTSSQYTPFFAMFGCHPDIPSTITGTTTVTNTMDATSTTCLSSTRVYVTTWLQPRSSRNH